MKIIKSFSIFTALLIGLIVSAQISADELSLDKIFKESKEKQLCGEFTSDGGIYDKLIFSDKNNVTMVSSVMEFPWIHYISDGVVHIKTDKAFLEFEIKSPNLIIGKDMFTKGHTYKKVGSAKKSCLPPEKAEMKNLICYTTGVLLQKKGKINEAAEQYLSCCNSGHAESCNNHGVLKTFSREGSAAQMSYQKACDMGFGGGCSNLAYIEERKENLKKAKYLYQQACDKGFQRGCYKANEFNLDSPEAFVDRGLAYLKKGKDKRAIINFSKAILLDPKNIDAYTYRSASYEWLGEYDLATADLSTLIEITPNNPKLYSVRGNNYFYTDKIELAASDFRKVIQLNPDASYERLHLVNTLSRSSKDRNSQDMASLRTFINGSNVDDWFKVISQYYIGGSNITEEDVLQMARKSDDFKLVNGRLCEAYYYLAEERLRKGNVSGAIDFYKKSIATKEKDFTEYLFSKKILAGIEKNSGDNNKTNVTHRN